MQLKTKRWLCSKDDRSVERKGKRLKIAIGKIDL